MDDKKARATFAALANDSRLQMIRALVQAGSAGLPAGELAEAVGATPSRASFHLSTLAEVGLVTATRDTRQIIYRIDFARMGGLVTYLTHLLHVKTLPGSPDRVKTAKSADLKV